MNSIQADRPSPLNQRRIALFIAVSVGLHLLLLSLFLPSLGANTSRESDDGGRSLLQLSLNPEQQTHQPAQAVTTQPAPQSQIAQESKTFIEPEPVNEIAVTQVTTPISEPVSNTQQTAPAAITEAAAVSITPPLQTQESGFDAEAHKTRVIQRIRQDLKQHFSYPAMARRKGWEGVVWLSFELDDEGYMSDIVVAQSSGHSLLDKAALKSLNSIKRLSPAYARPDGKRMRLRLPIDYQLRS